MQSTSSHSKLRFLPFPIGLQEIAVLFGIISLVYVQFANFAGDPGVGWHLKTGEHIVATASIPQIDPFLDGPYRRFWISDQWLSDLGLWLLYRGGGFPLVYAALAVIYLLTFFGVLYTGVSRITGRSLAATFSTLAAFKIAQIHFVLRPVMFSFLFFAAAYVMTMRWYRAALSSESPAETAPLFKRAAIILPLLFAVWCNSHPGFILGLALLALFPIGLMLDVFFAPARWNDAVRRATAARAGAVFLLCAAATLLNPYGLELHRSIAALGRSEFFMAFHEEWLSPNFAAPEGQVFQGMLLFVLAAFILRAMPERVYGCFDLLLIGLFLHLSLDAVRVLPYFGIVMALPCAEAWGICAPWVKHAGLRRLAMAARRLEERERASHRGYSVLAAGCALILASALLRSRVLTFDGPFGPHAQRYPYAAVEQLIGRDGVSTVLAPANWGGFITWHGSDKLRAVIDDRNTMLGEEIYRSYHREVRPGGDWEGYCRSTGASVIMLPRGTELAQAIGRERRDAIIYEDAVALTARCGSK